MSIHSAVEFTRLPLDVIEQITCYLSTNDLLACSLVSIGWREAINNDILWIKRCKGGYVWKSYAEYLENQKCQVEPFFELPQCVEDTLEPLCKWRIHFMTQIHFKRNLHRNRNKKYTILGNFNTNRMIYYEAENIVVIPTKSDQYEIWNTDGFPFCQDIIDCAIINADQFVYVHENYIVILEFNLFQVYENCGCKYKLLYRKLFDQPDNLSLNIPSTSDITLWYWNFHKKIVNYYKKICFKNIFIGFNCESGLKNSVFHVWDFKKGIKVKEQKFVDVPNICDVHFYKSVSFVYIVFETQNSNNERQTMILGYNAITQNYTDLCIKINCSHSQRYFFFDENYVVTLHSNIIDIWDSSKNNKKRSFMDLETCPFPLALVILNTHLIYAGNGSYSSRLTFLDLETLQIKIIIVLCYPIYRLMFAKPNLLLTKANTRGTDEYEVTIWDVKNILNYKNLGFMIHSFKVREQFSGSLKLSKLISIQPRQFCVTHFW